MVSMGPVEEPFSYSKQQRPAGAASASAVSASPAIIYSCWRPSLRYNGQVIHPLRLLARETTTAPGRQHSSSLLIAFRISASRDARERKRERGAREGNCTEERKRREIGSAHTYSCPSYFRPRSLLCTSHEIALDHSRKSSPDRFDKNCHCRRVYGTIALFANE